MTLIETGLAISLIFNAISIVALIRLNQVYAQDIKVMEELISKIIDKQK